jgi:hypothetical protein
VNSAAIRPVVTFLASLALLLFVDYLLVSFILFVAPEQDQLKIMRLLWENSHHHTTETQRSVDAAFSAAHWKTLAMVIVALIVLGIANNIGVKLLRRLYHKCRIALSTS